MENSGNLKYPSWPVLLTNPSAANLNVFKNPVTNLIELVLPTLGKSIPLGTDTYVSVTLPNIATKKVGGIDLTGVYPASDINYEYGFTIEMLRKQPGVDNDEYWPLMFHFYDKMNTILPPASGEVDIQNANQLTMITNLLAQANDSQVGEEYNLPDLLEVGYKFNITINLASPVTLVFGSTSIAVTTINNLVINASDIIFVITANSGTIWSGVLMVPYSVGAPSGSTTLAAITKYGIYFKSLTEVWDWNVKIDEFQWEEHEFSYLIYDALVATAPIHKISFGTANSSGESNLDADSAAEDTNVKLANVVNALAIPGVSAFAEAEKCTTIYATVPMTVHRLPGTTLVIDNAVKPPSGVTTYSSMSSKTIWKQLTADQVFKTFAHMQNLGELSVLVRGDVPADEEYVKISIVHKGHTHASMHSASGFGQGEQRLYIYMPKAKFIEKVYATASSTLAVPLAAGSANSVSMIMNAATTASGNLGFANAVGSWKDYTVVIA